ncbi:MAG: amidase [Deltaproteobacteria bacterium]|nr:amidase [Deltaproteobacteria bacterium]
MVISISEYKRFDGLGLADLIQRKEVSPLELLETAIGEIERLNPRLNAVIYSQYDRAREYLKSHSLKGPFAGVPFLLKDLGTFEKGVPVSFGSKFCKDFIAPETSEITSRFQQAGFVTLGRTNTPEFGLHPTTEPENLGPTKNPWSLEYTAGGSSGGSAAAVASGMVPIAHGGDGGGSIRIPASCCGLFGLKPSEGRSPIGPSGGRLWHGFVVEHVLTRSVRDSAAVLDILSEPCIGAPILSPKPDISFSVQLQRPPKKLKIALFESPVFKADLHNDCRLALHDAAKTCENLGHIVEPVDFKVSHAEFEHACLVIVAAETTAFLDMLSHLLGRKPKRGEIEVATQVCIQAGKAFTASDYAHAVRIMDEVRRHVAHFFKDFDLVMTPTLALPPKKLGTLGPTAIEKQFLKLVREVNSSALTKLAISKLPEKSFQFSPYTLLFNVTGQPAMSVPLYWNSDNLPIGTQFAAKIGEEGMLLNLAQQLDNERKFSQKIAKLS